MMTSHTSPVDIEQAMPLGKTQKKPKKKPKKR